MKKITIATMHEVRALFDAGYSTSEIAKKLGLAEFQVVRLLRPFD